MTRRGLVLGLLLEVACGSAPPAVDGGAPGDAGGLPMDAGSDGGVLQAPCGLSAGLGALEVAEGGRLDVALALEPAVTGWSARVEGTLEVRPLDANRLRLSSAAGDPAPGTLVLELRCGGRSESARAAVSVRRPRWAPLAQWTEGPGAPPNREYGVFWQDSGDADRLLLYGGFHYRPKQFTPSSDLWEFKLSTGTWSQLSVIDAPQFMGGRVAPVPGAREVLFLGGVDATFTPSWHFERLAYAPPAPRFSPQASTGAPAFGDYQPGFVFDSKRNRYLTFCGQSQDVHCRVRSLTLDPATGAGAWADVAVAGEVPRGRAGHFFAYDAEEDRVVLFGGDANGVILSDTWALELSKSPARWELLADSPQLARRNGAFALDEPNHRLLVWGGTPDGRSASPNVISLNLDRGYEVWSTLEPQGTTPPPRASGVAVYDAAGRRFIAGFGNTSAGFFPDLWALSL